MFVIALLINYSEGGPIAYFEIKKQGTKILLSKADNFFDF